MNPLKYFYRIMGGLFFIVLVMTIIANPDNHNYEIRVLIVTVFSGLMFCLLLGQ